MLSTWTVVACSPAPSAILAVERTDPGKARVLIAPCADYAALQFDVFSSGGTVGYKIWAIDSDAMGGPLSSVDLFTAPPGWSVAESSLTDLKGAHEYTVVLEGAVGSRGLDGEISFTPAQFEGLKDGEVLVRDDGETKKIKSSEFMKKDSGRCAAG
ncbi:hypothetical protein [Streptomyces sp. NPDC057939]|uniref:hypothetical protein n=1 Tax=Streptomyces sp. NPDC057939 TaxID=3346284 RepID=UPI0036E15F9E